MEHGDSLKIIIVGSVRLQVIADDKERTITLTDVYLVPQLARNFVSYGKLEQKRFMILYSESSRSLVRRSDGAIAFYVSMQTNVLYV